MFCQLAKQLHDLFSAARIISMATALIEPLSSSWHLVHPLAASVSPNPRLKTFYAVAACGIKLNGYDEGGGGRTEAEGDRTMMRSVEHRWRRWRGKLLIYIIVTFMPRLGFGISHGVAGGGVGGVAVGKRVIRLKRLSRRCCFCLQCNALFARN